MRNFDKISQHDLISILWLLCHLHSINITLKSINKSKQKYMTKRANLPRKNKQYPYLRGVNKHTQEECYQTNFKNTNTTFTPQNAYMSQHKLSARNNFPAADLEKEQIIRGKTNGLHI